MQPVEKSLSRSMGRICWSRIQIILSLRGATDDWDWDTVVLSSECVIKISMTAYCTFYDVSVYSMNHESV